MKCATALMLLLMLSLTACGTAGRASPQTFCTAGHPIYLSKEDKLTKETTRAIVGHNETGKKLCGWKPAK